MVIQRWLGVVAVLMLGVFGIGWGWIGPDSMDGKCHYQKNALWLSVDWTSTPVESAAIALLAEQAQTHQVRYLYPYVSYLKADGTWSQSYDHARDFLAAYKSLDPNAQTFAWIGIPLQNSASVGVQGWVELQEAATRQQIAEFARQMIALGFDGVHLNVESVRNEDAAFLSLLEEVRAAIGDRAILSIAGAHWNAAPIRTIPIVGSFGWQSSYYNDVAMRVDQIATMTYDSHLPTAALYRLWMREQVRGVSASLEGLPVEMLFGVSVSRENTPSHQSEAEALASGLTGICAGMETGQSKQGNSSSQQGVAIYAAWEMTESDWAELKAWHD